MPLCCNEDDFKKKFEGKFPDFEYVSGYKGYESQFTCKCRKCGHLQERNAQCAKPSKKHTLWCDNCIEVAREAKHEAKVSRERKQNEYTEAACALCNKTFVKHGNNQKFCSNECYRISKHNNYISRAVLKKKKCAECGKEFETSSKGDRRYCSDGCKKKASNRMREISRRHKLRKNGIVDYTISLARLIIRDRNTCYICGDECDSNDYTLTDEGFFIAGEIYPSIDHVIPVSKGGTHIWGNVRLAHRCCNSIKRDKLFYEKENGQITLAI